MSENIKKIFQSYLDEKKFAGVNMIVRKDGEEVLRYKAGHRDIENNLPAEYDTIFRLASMTKPVISVAAMILSDRGLLDIDDDIAKYIPAFANMQAADHMVGFMDIYEAAPENPMIPKFHPEKLEGIELVPVENPIKIRHILGHCSGMGQGPYSCMIYEKGAHPGQTLKERVNWIAQVPLDFQPGDFAGYSAGVAFEVLGRIIEIISGKDLNTFIQDEICQPLGIKDLGYCLNAEQLGRVSKLYEAGDGKLTDVTETDAPWKMVNPLVDGYYSGSAGMLGSLEAYDHFAAMLAGGGALNGVRILKEETVKQMTVNSSNKHLTMEPGIGWGLGMIVHEDTDVSGRKVSVGSFGWSGAYGCHFFIDPVKHISAVMMMAVSNIGGANSPLAVIFENCVEEM